MLTFVAFRNISDMDLSIFMFWSDSQIVFWCAVIVTAVALTISTGYTLKSLFNVWNSKKLKIPSSASTSATGSVSVSDADDKTTKDDIGCDGDAEPDAEVDKQTENTFEGKTFLIIIIYIFSFYLLFTLFFFFFFCSLTSHAHSNQLILL